MFVEMYDNCNVYIFWIGATEVESAVNFKKFIFREITKYIELDVFFIVSSPDHTFQPIKDPCFEDEDLL